MSTATKCLDCEQLTQADHIGAWAEVTGWTVRRSGGGSNAVRSPQPTGRVICPSCGKLRDLGVTPGQQGLFSEGLF